MKSTRPPISVAMIEPGTSSRRRPVVFSLGYQELAEFRLVRSKLLQTTELVELDFPHFSEIDSAESPLPVPDWIICWQSHLDTLSRSELEHLRRLFPLAQFVRVLGTWCEGEVRNSLPWPGTVRLYWYQADTRLDHELHAFATHQTTWGTNFTSNNEDQLIQQCRAEGLQPEGSGLLIGIQAATWETAASLADACWSLGYSACWLTPENRLLVRGLSALVFDFFGSNDQELAMLAKLRKQWPDLPILATVTYPRVEQISQLTALGKCTVLAKPWYLTDFAQCLKSLTVKT